MKIKTGKAESKRLFIAITLPEDLRFQLFESVKDLAEKDPAIKTIIPECIHLTLKFLGNTDIMMLRSISAAISDTAEAIKSFDITPGNTIEAFPGFQSARILFLPIKDIEGQTAAVFELLESNLAKIHVKKDERKFIPHITIARVRENLNSGTSDFIKKVSINPECSIICNKITLIESRLKPSGPDYIILEEFNLK